MAQVEGGRGGGVLSVLPKGDCSIRKSREDFLLKESFFRHSLRAPSHI